MSCSGCSIHTKALNFQNLPSIWGQHQSIIPLGGLGDWGPFNRTRDELILELFNSLGITLTDEELLQLSIHAPDPLAEDLDSYYFDRPPWEPWYPRPVTPIPEPLPLPPDTFWKDITGTGFDIVTSYLAVLSQQASCRNILNQLSQNRNSLTQSATKIRNQITSSLHNADNHGATKECKAAYLTCVQDILDQIDKIEKEMASILNDILPQVDCDSYNPFTLLADVALMRGVRNKLDALAQKLSDLSSKIKDCDKLLANCDNPITKPIPILATRPIGETTKKILNILTSVRNDIIPPDGDNP